MRKKLTSIVVLCSTICLVATGIVAYANVSDSSFSSRNQKSTDNMISETIPENETVNASARKLNTAVNYNIASKDDIYHMMLNTIDYYDKVSGTIYFPAPGDLNLVNTVEFQSVLSEKKAYSHYSQAYADNITAESIENISSEAKNTDNLVWDEKYYCNADESINLNCLEKTYKTLSYDTIGLEAVCEIPDDERITEIDGEPCYNYRTNPTNVPEASICIFPQEMTFGYLANQNLWSINGTKVIDDKLCYHISGTAEEDYGSKFNVSTFELMVDVNTGVLIQYIGYDDNGEISDYIYTKNISFENKADKVETFSNNELTGYEEYQKN
ncbi:MAG: hypothetical protein ACLU4K_05910 [Oscillospiraceae bacterium]